VLTARMNGAAAHTQPIFHPVTLKDFPALEIVTVRSRIPGSVASGMWAVPS
jgi:hypothetical protein